APDPCRPAEEIATSACAEHLARGVRDGLSGTAPQYARSDRHGAVTESLSACFGRGWEAARVNPTQLLPDGALFSTCGWVGSSSSLGRPGCGSRRLPSPS